MIETARAKTEDIDEIMEVIQPFVDAQILLPRNREEIQRLSKRGFVAVCDGRVIGFASVEIYSSKLSEIQCLAVKKEFQHKGVGKLLVADCINLAREEGVIELMAISSSEEFLKSCGFDYSLPDQKRALFYRFDQD